MRPTETHYAVLIIINNYIPLHDIVRYMYIHMQGASEQVYATAYDVPGTQNSYYVSCSRLVLVPILSAAYSVECS